MDDQKSEPLENTNVDGSSLGAEDSASHVEDDQGEHANHNDNSAASSDDNHHEDDATAEMATNGLESRQISSIAKEAQISALHNVVSSVYDSAAVSTALQQQQGDSPRLADAVGNRINRAINTARNTNAAANASRWHEQTEAVTMVQDSSDSLTASEKMLHEKLLGRFAYSDGDIPSSNKQERDDDISTGLKNHEEQNLDPRRDSSDDKLAETLAMDEMSPLPPPLTVGSAHRQPGAFRFSTARPPRRVDRSSNNAEDDDEPERTRRNSHENISSDDLTPPTPDHQRQRTMLLEATLVESERDNGTKYTNQDGEYPEPVPTATVQSSTFVEAKEVNIEDHDIVPMRKKCRAIGILAIIVLAGVAGVLIGIFVGSSNGNDSTQDATDRRIPTLPPTRQPVITAPPTLDGGLHPNLSVTLPEPSRRALLDPMSPESQSLEWLRASPYLSTYTLQRQQQLFALATLYFEAEGDRWFFNDDWLNYNVSECEWFSTVTSTSACYEGTELLRYLALERVGLKGTIPGALSLLTGLEILDFDDNILAGLIPTYLANMTNLEQCWLSSNALSGSLPTGLDALSRLEFFNLGLQSGKIVGRLPEYAFQSWRNMQFIDLSFTSLTGQLPSTVAYMTDLSHLFFYEMNLDGPLIDEISNLTNLEVLYLDGNLFTGTIPNSWGALTKLQNLDIYFNDLSGTMPSELCSLVRTNNLVIKPDCDKVECDCCDCSLTVTISPYPTTSPSTEGTEGKPTLLPSISATTNTPIEDVTSAPSSDSLYPTSPPSAVVTEQPTYANPIIENFRASLPDYAQAALLRPDSPQARALSWLGNNTNLSTYNPIRLTQRYVLATLFYASSGEQWIKNDGWLSDDDECSWSTNDRESCNGQIFGFLVLNRRRLLGTIPPEIGMLTLLNELDLSQNRLGGNIPTTIALMENLEGLWLFDNALAGRIPTLLGAMKQLSFLDLSENNVSGPIPEELFRLTMLIDLWLSDNALTGTLSESFSSLSNLEYLILEANSIEGQVPVGLQSLVNLRFLSLTLLELSGLWPDELWGSLTKLESFQIAENFLNGTISTGIGQLSRVAFLDMYLNEFTGPIPTEIGRLMNASEIVLDGNYLTGNIPSELALLPRLTTLLLHDNELSGSVPSELCERVTNFSLLLSVDCDWVQCDCACECGMSGI